MGRWIAIGTAPGWGDIKTFEAEMAPTDEWRVDTQTTITSVFALEDGRMLAECHATKREDFEAWLKQKDWKVESITQIKHLAKSGSIWNVPSSPH